MMWMKDCLVYNRIYIRSNSRMSGYYVGKIHNDLNNVDMYLQEHFERISYDSDEDYKACIKDVKYITKRLKKLDRIEKIMRADR